MTNRNEKTRNEKKNSTKPGRRSNIKIYYRSEKIFIDEILCVKLKQKKCLYKKAKKIEKITKKRNSLKLLKENLKKYMTNKLVSFYNCNKKKPKKKSKFDIKKFS